MGTFVIGVGPLVNVLAHDVVPPDHRASFAVYERGDPVGKQHLHFAIIVEILFFHEAADVAVGFPRFGVDFVSAYVYVATWKQIENFVENILYELYYTATLNTPHVGLKYVATVGGVFKEPSSG